MDPQHISLGSYTNHLSRRHLYASIRTRTPRPIDPKSHTMGPDALKAYMGNDSRKYEPVSKKLEVSQRKDLFEAVKSDRTVRVFGAYRDDIGLIAEILGYDIEPDSEKRHRRAKVFNDRRQVSCIARKQGLLEEKSELWFFVFPSTQYVDQVGELIDALMAEFAKPKKVRKSVEIVHFPLLEATITTWTGFSEGIRNFIRNGDVVGIGNVDLLEDSLADLGFEASSANWTRFGLGGMFGYKVLANRDASGARLVLVGMSESFWGESSAQYVRALIEAGACHILYGSKASTLIDKEYIHQVVTPSSFLILEDDDARPRAVGERCDERLTAMMGMLGIKIAGSAITVPTVMGEDHPQQAKYADLSPSCMECEGAHIATVIAEFNTRMAKLGYGQTSYVKFVAIHFVTDYIYKKSQNARHTEQNLSVRPPEGVKKEAFDKIGRFMGLYALRYGLRDQANFFPDVGIDTNKPQKSLSDIIENWRPLLDFDRGQEAISALLSGYRDRTVGPDVLIAIAMIAQKCGYTDIYLEADARLYDPKIDSELSRENRLRRDVIRLKYLTQRGSNGDARQVIEAVRSQYQNGDLKQINQVGAFYRRIAMVESADGNGAASHAALATAVDLLGSKADPHYEATNKLFAKIAGLRTAQSLGESALQSVANELSDIRAHYFALVTAQRSWWQMSMEKSANAALFVEAAYFLANPSTSHVTRGSITLLVAHLLNSQFGGQKGSETFGELVNSIVNPEVRLLLGLAMRKDLEGQTRFLEYVRAFPWSLRITQAALKIMAQPIDRREPALRALLELSHV